MKTIFLLCLFTADVETTSIWDCVKPATTPAVSIWDCVAPQIVPASVNSFWDAVQPIPSEPPDQKPESDQEPMPPPIPTDEEIVNSISTEIAERIGDGIDIRVECKNGVVTITGTTSNDAQLQNIYAIAQMFIGVKSVTNNATVKKIEKTKPKSQSTRYTPRRIFRFRSNACVNGACNQ